MGVHLYTNGAWTDSGRIYRNSLNLFDGNYELAYMSGAANAQYSTNIADVRTAVIPCEPNTKYSILRSDDGNRLRIATYTVKPINNTTGTLLHDSMTDVSTTITTPANAAYLAVYVISGATQSTNVLTMIVEGDIVPTSYEPYNVVDWYTNTGHGYSSGAWD